MKTILIYIFYFFLLILIASIDSSFLPALGTYWSYFNITLVLSLYLTIMVNRNIGIIVFTVLSFITGFTSSSSLILPIISGYIVLILLDLLLQTIFVNRAYYSLVILGAIGWTGYYILLYLFIAISSFFLSSSYLLDIDLTSFFLTMSHIFFAEIILTMIYFLSTNIIEKVGQYFILSEN